MPAERQAALSPTAGCGPRALLGAQHGRSAVSTPEPGEPDNGACRLAGRRLRLRVLTGFGPATGAARSRAVCRAGLWSTAAAPGRSLGGPRQPVTAARAVSRFPSLRVPLLRREESLGLPARAWGVLGRRSVSSVTVVCFDACGGLAPRGIRRTGVT